MAAPIQATIADQHGIDIHQLCQVIEAGYRSVNGHPVKVKIGQGLHIDGVPEGLIRLVDRRA